MADAFFIELYTRLTVFLNEHVTQAFGGKINFKAILLTKCQDKFYNSLNDEVHFLPDDSEDVYERKIKKKDKQLGNIRFTANLCLENVMAKKVGLMLLDELLTAKTDMTLESAKVILEVLLKALYEYTRSHKDMKLLSIMERIKTIVDDKDDTTIKPRTKFMLQDQLEKYSKLRAEGGSK